MYKTATLVLTIAVLATGIVGSVIATAAYAQSQDPCPDPGQCTCNPSTGVMTDHAMSQFNQIHNNCKLDSNGNIYVP